jgi:hypothetical protein
VKTDALETSPKVLSKEVIRVLPIVLVHYKILCVCAVVLFKKIRTVYQKWYGQKILQHF